MSKGERERVREGERERERVREGERERERELLTVYTTCTYMYSNLCTHS